MFCAPQIENISFCLPSLFNDMIFEMRFSANPVANTNAENYEYTDGPFKKN